MTDQTAQLTWRDTDAGAVPVSTRFDDPYYSLTGGLAETRHVFLAGNDLPARFGGDFLIAELGFGTGLNALATLLAWQAAGAPGSVRFVSFEAYPMTPDAMTRALAAFPEVAEAATLLTQTQDYLSAPHALAPGFTLQVIVGDAGHTVPAWDGQADAWFLDGFSPAKNPELWSPALMQGVHDHTRPGGTAATYSAAGQVRAGLTAAGFEVTRVPGFGRKRHMTRAVRP